MGNFFACCFAKRDIISDRTLFANQVPEEQQCCISWARRKWQDQFRLPLLDRNEDLPDENAADENAAGENATKSWLDQNLYTMELCCWLWGLMANSEYLHRFLFPKRKGLSLCEDVCSILVLLITCAAPALICLADVCIRTKGMVGDDNQDEAKTDEVELVLHIALMFEIMANTHFGWKFLDAMYIATVNAWVKDARDITTLIAVSDNDYQLPEYTNREGRSAICVCGWLITVSSILLRVLLDVLTDAEPEADARVGSWPLVGFVVLDGVIFGAAYAIVFYLCLLWMWTNWMFYIATSYAIEHHIDATGIENGNTEKALLCILKIMDNTSKQWAYNHLIRCASCTLIAVSWFFRGLLNQGKSNLLVS
jgi:hypothetical protein